VTLEAFQQALCDLVASPNLVRRLRDDPESVLADYELSERERHRLITVAGQPGMAASCSLYRMNRVTPLYTYLRLTCHALGDALRAELDRFWEQQPPHAQYEREVGRFADFLRSRVSAGAVPQLVEEVLDLELAVNSLRYPQRDGAWSPATASDALPVSRLHVSPDVRVARLRREPLALLSALDTRAPLDDVPRGDHYVLARIDGDGLDVLPLKPELGKPMLAIAQGDGESVPAETVELLLNSGLVVTHASPDASANHAS
jgi:hypothetical protein